MACLLVLLSSLTPGNGTRVSLVPFKPELYLASENKPNDAFSCSCGETGPTENGPHYQMIGVAGVVSRHDHRKQEHARINARLDELKS